MLRVFVYLIDKHHFENLFLKVTLRMPRLILTSEYRKRIFERRPIIKVLKKPVENRSQDVGFVQKPASSTRWNRLRANPRT
jgi:hypothetical protein